MVLKALVDAISQSLRDPHNLLHMQLVSSLKRSISQDITEAFTESQPLVDKYPDLYRESSSFLDFLFKICSAPNPPTPRASDGRDSERYERQLVELNNEIDRLNTILVQKEYTENDLRRKLEECQQQSELRRQEASLLQGHLKVCQDELQRSSDRHSENPVPAQSAIVTVPPECQSGALPSSSNPLPLEYSTTDPSETKLEEWHDKLYEFLSDFKSEMSDKFKISEENNAKLNELMKEHFPNKDPTPVPTEPLGSVDAFSEALFKKLEEFLSRYLDEEQLEESLKLFGLDKLFADLTTKVNEKFKKIDITSVELSKNSVLLCKNEIKTEIGSTKTNIKKVIQGFVQKISTLSSSKLSYVSLLEKFDQLEQSFLNKSAEFERLLEKTSSETKGGLMSDIQDFTQKITDKVFSQKTDDLKKRIDAQTEAIQSNLSALQTTSYHDRMTDSPTLKFDRDSLLKNASSLLDYVKIEFPKIGHKHNWGEELMTVLSDFKDTKKYMRDILNKFDHYKDPDYKLVNLSNLIVDSLLKSFLGANEKVNRIYATMESIMGGQSQYLGSHTEMLDEKFFKELFGYINDVRVQMQTAHLQMTEAEYTRMQPSLSPNSGENPTIEECDDDMNDETLAIRDMSLIDRFRSEQEDLKRQLSDLKASMAQREAEYKISNDFNNSLRDALQVTVGGAIGRDTVLERIRSMKNELVHLNLENRKVMGEKSELEKLLSDTNKQSEQYEEKVKSQELVIHENERVIKRFQDNQNRLEAEYKEHALELEGIHKKYNDQISKLKSQLNEKSEKLMQSPKRRKTSSDSTPGKSDEESGFVGKNEITLKLLKQLFLVFYEKYFKILYQYKWAQLEVPKTELREELVEKLKHVNQLQIHSQRSTLIDILLRYVMYEFQVLTEGATSQIIDKDVEDVGFLDDLITKAINHTTLMIRRGLLNTRMPNTSQLQMDVSEQATM